MSAAHITGREAGPDGHMVGRDPRQMSQDELRAIGHECMPPMEAIRAKCLDCCAGSPNEVRLCVAVSCPSWPFRTGKNPWRAPASDARRESARATAARMNAARRNHGQGPALGAGAEGGAALASGAPFSGAQ